MYSTWRDKGACTDLKYQKLDWFSNNETEQSTAQAICASCPVRLTCLQHALAVPEMYGTWGGLPEAQIRHTLAVDEDGEPLEKGHKAECPGCGTTEITVTRKMRNRSYVCCDFCALDWVVARPKKKRILVKNDADANTDGAGDQLG